MYSALDIAKWFIAETNAEKNLNQSTNNDYDIYEGITHLKLQKLLYFAQGVCLAETGEPLFYDNIEAWSYGPVVRSIYEKFVDNGRNNLELDMENPENSSIVDKILNDTKVRKILDFVYENFASYTAWKLVDMTHKIGTPWDITREKNNNEKDVIDNSLIKDYFVREIME